MKSKTTYKIVVDTPYYRTGPQQGYPPEGKLASGTTVHLVQDNGAYAQVELEDGSVVYVESKNLKVARSKSKGEHARFNEDGERQSPGDMLSNRLDEVELNYGDRSLPLVKSNKYIAVKPRPGIKKEVLSAIVPEASKAGASASKLGGFQLINVDEVSDDTTEDTLDMLRENPAVKSGTHVFHTSDDEVPFVPTGQIYIECAPEATVEQCQDLLEEHHLEIVEARGEKELVVQVTPQSANPIKVAAALQKSPLIKVAEPDLATPGKIHAFGLPIDERLADQWHLRNTGFHRGTSLGFLRGADARVQEAWEASESLGSPTVIVAIIDDGFDLSHPDLSGSAKIVAPKDFTRNTDSPVPDPFNEDWHGTACAGVAVGNADGTGIVGAAPKSRFMPVRWGVDLSDKQIENWFGYVREQGAWVVSCSWGAAAKNFPLSTRASRAISRCAKEGRNGLGTVICFAAGNENRDINSPATRSVNGFAIHRHVIAVAASNSRDKRSSYSNFGKEISICAPSNGSGGWGITTSDVMGQYTKDGQTLEAGYDAGPYTNDFGGTSSACPLVAGICALILSVKPTLSSKEVRGLIERTARKIGPSSAYNAQGHSIQFGHGCIDAFAAVNGLPDEAMIEPFWGKRGHELVNKLAISAVPSELRDFYSLFVDDMVKHAMDADKVKTTNPSEKPHHFIDIDLYGAPPFSELPEEYEEAVEKFGLQTVTGRGIVPWHIETTYRLLVSAFQDKNLTEVLRHSAWLGHYVGDAHVPFHVTANHDGQLTGQKGLHSYFESQVLNRFVSPQEIHPKTGKQISQKPHRLSFQWVRESYSFVQPLLDADAANGGKTKKRNLKGFAKIAKPIAIDRLAKSCSRTASLWYSAWVEAGRPETAVISDERATVESVESNV